MGVYLSQPNTNKNFQEEKGEGLAFCSAQMQGWRKTMEDAAIHTVALGDGNSLFAVFDGHGGPQISHFVSTIFTKILTGLKSYQSKDYKSALDKAFRKIDENIQSSQGQKALRKIKNGEASYNEESEFIGGAVGCTANVVLITPEAYFVANAGDSRSVLCRDGKAINLSEDHKPESPEEENRIKKAGGTITMGRVNGGLNLTRSFADFDYKRNKDLPYSEQMITCKPDVKVVERRKGHDQFIVLGCDGIWERYVENSQGLIDIVKQGLAKHKTYKKIVEDLLDQLVATETTGGIGCDNMTAILIVFAN